MAHTIRGTSENNKAIKMLQVEAGVSGGDSRKAEQREGRRRKSMWGVERQEMQERKRVCGFLLINKEKYKQRAVKLCCNCG